MGLRDRMFEMTEVEHVDEFFKRYPAGAFFKAGACHKTMQGFGYVEQALDQREEIFVGFVKVIDFRPVSNYIAEITGVVHQSPQFILYKEGRTVYDVDNWDITLEALQNALDTHLGLLKNKPESQKKADADASLYLSLLNAFLNNELSEDEFQYSWLNTFQNDAAPRSSEQFNLLNSLYGDVDAAIASGPLAVAKETGLKERARKLYQTLLAAQL